MVHDSKSKTSVGRVIWAEHGAAVGEYAALLGILGLLVCAVLGVGILARATFRDARHGVDGAAVARASGTDPSRQEAGAGGLAARSVLITGWNRLTGRQGTQVAVAGLCLAAVAGLGIYFASRGKCPFRHKATTQAHTPEPIPLAHEQLLFQKRNVIRRLLLRRMDDQREGRAWLVRAGDIMTSTPVQIGPATPVPKIAELMQERRIRHVLVVDHEDRLLGVISDRDVCRARGKTAREVMSQPPITVSPDSDIIPAVTVILQRRISCLPVLQDAKLCGILTATDILIAFQALIQSLDQFDTMAAPTGEEAPLLA